MSSWPAKWKGTGWALCGRARMAAAQFLDGDFIVSIAYLKQYGVWSLGICFESFHS